MEILAYHSTMNRTERIQRRSKHMNRLLRWPLFCGLLGLAFARTDLMAGDFAGDTYINNNVVSYPGTETYPPVIDATNFINNSSFTINFTTFSAANQFYETWNTVNFNNSDNGVMTVNTGFRFDTQSTGTGLHTMAGSFNNSGTISCASVNDTSSFYSFGLYGSYSGYGLYGYAQFVATATNIVNSGVVDVGVDGLMQFTGENVDLSRGQLTMEGFGLFSNQGIFGVAAAFGANTNWSWMPAIELTPTNAYSSGPIFLDLTNTTAYIETNSVSSNTVVVRAVFIYNPSPNVTNNVYFGANTVGSGAVTIEWVGSYLDSASGATLNNYLYLNDDYLRGASTNVYIYNGIPDNFTFLSSPTPILLGVPTTSGFPTGFAFQPRGIVTNNTYSYVSTQITSSTVSTNDDITDPNHSITNLMGRIQISASKELNLSLAQITGANYLSLQATNQFDGNEGALISAPYADINIGVTNGFLTVSNLLESAVPNWSGNIQAWSGRWIYVDANGVTNDYRVLLVGSQVAPSSSSQVQDLILHGTNSIVISDTFNILRKFSADAQNLTLTTNGSGVGAASLAGELNWVGAGTFGPTQLPNLRFLTNNGAIRAPNLAQFTGNANTYSSTITPGTPAVVATGKLSELVGANVKKGAEVSIGTNQYVFVNLLTNRLANQVKIAANFDGSMSNLIAAINRSTGAGTSYSTNTKANPLVAAGPLVTSGSLTNHAFVLTATTNGAAGNGIVTTTTSTNLSWNGHGTLFGGLNATPAVTNTTVTSAVVPYDAFINHGLLSDQGTILYAKNFLSSGVISNGVGNLTANSLTTTLTNGAIYAGGNISLTTGSLLASNLTLQCLSLTLTPTNFIDAGLTNGNFWTVGRTNGTGGQGFSLTIKPPVGDMLGTTITNICPGPNKSIVNTWAGTNVGVSVLGFSNNMALGRLVLTSPGSTSKIIFNGATGVSNALYVDYLEFRDYCTNGTPNGSPLNFPWLTINTNMVIYYAQAVMNGVSIAENLDFASRFQGANGGRLRWVPTYNGYFSSTNLVYPAGVTNAFNAALAGSTVIDSDGDGVDNANDSTPFFLPAQVNFTLALTNLQPLSVRVQWTTVANATNSIEYRTNLATGSWLPFTNFNNYYYANNLPVTNAAHSNTFASPQVYQAYPNGSPATNVWIFDVVTNTPHFYRVLVQPWVTYPY